MTAKPFRGHSIQLIALPLPLNAEPFHCASVSFLAFPLLFNASHFRCCSGLIISVPSCAVAAPLISLLFRCVSVSFLAFPLLSILRSLSYAIAHHFLASLFHYLSLLCPSFTRLVSALPLQRQLLECISLAFPLTASHRSAIAFPRKSKRGYALAYPGFSNPSRCRQSQ